MIKGYIRYYNYDADSITVGNNIREGLTERGWIINGLKEGSKGDIVWRDGDSKCICREDGNWTNLPTCGLYDGWDPETENSKLIGHASMEDAVSFLLGEEYEMH